jgi:ankyrin repeat protein
VGNLSLVQLLVDNQANINITGGHERMTVLHEAALNEHIDETIVKFLLENGADSQIK